METIHQEPLNPNEKPFFTKVEMRRVSVSDLNQVRQWKNILVGIKDKYKGTDKYVMWELELKRVIEFLQKDEFKDFED